MGFGQVLAALYWIAITLSLEGFNAYTLPCALIAGGFSARTFYFFYSMAYEVSTVYDNTARYYQEFKYTIAGIIVGFLTNTALSYLEWGVLPVWSLIFWTFFFTIDYYNAMTVKEYGEITDDEGYYNPFQATGAYGAFDPSKTQANKSSSKRDSTSASTGTARIGTDASAEGIKLIVL